MGNQERWRGSRQLPHDIVQRLEKLNPLFKKEGVLLVYLYGSLGKGLAGNDIDLAVLSRNKPVYQLREKIADTLVTERIDLVDLESASPLLRFEIISTGRALYVADESQRERFELATLHLYRDTAPLRLRQEDYLKRRMVQWSSSEKLS
jgi:predicted nucleotidyltransferase